MGVLVSPVFYCNSFWPGKLVVITTNFFSSAAVVVAQAELGKPRLRDDSVEIEI
jgi:hypothetical protein